MIFSEYGRQAYDLEVNGEINEFTILLNCSTCGRTPCPETIHIFPPSLTPSPRKLIVGLDVFGLSIIEKLCPKCGMPLYIKAWDGNVSEILPDLRLTSYHYPSVLNKFPLMLDGSIYGYLSNRELLDHTELRAQGKFTIFSVGNEMDLNFTNKYLSKVDDYIAKHLV